MVDVNYAEEVLRFLGNPVLEQLSLGLIQSLIGLIFGMSLVYMGHTTGKRKTLLIVPLILIFYIAIFLLADYTFARRLIQVFALAHVAMVGCIILNKAKARERAKDERPS